MSTDAGSVSASPPIVVIGMNRSGTSSVAGALIKLGVHFGTDSDFAPADANNEDGYWEHQGIVDVSLQFMSSLNLRYFEYGPMPLNWMDFPRSSRLVQQLATLLNNRFGGHDPWGWKVPLSTVEMPFVNEVLRSVDTRPRYVLCVRNPIDVAASLTRRNELPEPLGLGMWLRYTLAGLHGSIGEARRVLMFGDYLTDPRSNLERIVEMCPKWSPSETSWAEACGHVRPELSHSRSSIGDLDRLPTIFRRTFELCEEASRCPTELNDGAFDGRIDGLWRELKIWMQGCGEPDPPLGELTLFLPSGTVSAQYEPRREWRAVSVKADVQDAKPVLACLYGFPGTVWMRRAVWRTDGNVYQAEIEPGPKGHIEREEGLQRLWVIQGGEQVVISPPPAGVPVEFEIELLVETNVRIVSQISERLSQELARVSQYIARMEGTVRR